MSRLSLSLDSTFEALERFMDTLAGFLESHVDDEDLAYTIALVASEAVTNAIEHGNALDPAKRVHIDISVGQGETTLVVEDEGGGFKRGAVKDPLAAEQRLSDGGRGLFIMEQLADQVRYEAEGRRVCLTISHPDGDRATT